MNLSRISLVAFGVMLTLVAACGGTPDMADEGIAAAEETNSDLNSDIDSDSNDETSEQTDTGIRLIDAEQGAAIQADPPDNLVVLDVRTPEEFAEGHIDGAIMVDFYEEDFAEQLGDLDPDVPYLLYCRSGNRSGQTATIMQELGFTDVADVDGGILAWADGGHPLVTD